MVWLQILFWLCAAAVVYTYALYPVLLALLAAGRQLRTDLAHVLRGHSRRRASVTDDALPTVAVLVAAHNEQRFIVERLANLWAQDYPAAKLRVYVGSDGSVDATNALLAQHAHERLVAMPFAQRRGKPSVLNDLAARAQEELLVFTDANTFFDADAVRQLARHFAEPRVGCVCGELRLVAAPGGENPDNLYWRYERMLKFFEGRLGALLGANGGVYAVRRALYRPIPPDTIVDDFSIAVGVTQAGWRCEYDPEARAVEEIPPRIQDEFRRRVRIGIGNYQALRRHVGLLHPRHGWRALAFLSHKVLRWFAPHCMVVALLASALLAPSSALFGALLLLQLLFYGAAGFGHWAGRRGAVPRALRLPTFFVSLNLGLLLGWYRYMLGGFSGTWARTAR